MTHRSKQLHMLIKWADTYITRSKTTAHAHVRAILADHEFVRIRLAIDNHLEMCACLSHPIDKIRTQNNLALSYMLLDFSYALSDFYSLAT